MWVGVLYTMCSWYSNIDSGRGEIGIVPALLTMIVVGVLVLWELGRARAVFSTVLKCLAPVSYCRSLNPAIVTHFMSAQMGSKSTTDGAPAPLGYGRWRRNARGRRCRLHSCWWVYNKTWFRFQGEHYLRFLYLKLFRTVIDPKRTVTIISIVSIFTTTWITSEYVLIPTRIYGHVHTWGPSTNGAVFRHWVPKI